MSYQQPILWNNFISSFEKNLNRLNMQNDLSVMLQENEAMTTFYKEQLFRNIANDIGLELFSKEYLRLDIMMHVKGSCGYEVPIVFVESENDPEGDLPTEIRKLLSVNAPLKILMTRGSFERDFMNDNHWEYLIKDFAEHGRLVGYFVVFTAHWQNDQLQFDYVCYDESGQLNGSFSEINLLNKF